MRKCTTNEQGNQYERWYVVCYAYNKNGYAYWNCRCDCGTLRVVRGYDLKSGKSQSCGCSRKENVIERNKQGMSIETRKKISTDAKKRFSNPENHPMYGKKRPEFSKLQIGKNNPNYKHGLSRTNEYKRMKNRAHKSLKAGAEGTHTSEDLKYIYYHQKGICPKCRKHFSFEKMTLDHIVPLTWGGSNYASNIQLLCGSCNSSKCNYNDTDYRDYVPLFLE